LETLEHATPILGGDAAAAIPDGDSRAARLRRKNDVDRPAGAEFDRVRQKVVDDLLDSELVPDTGYAVLDIGDQPAAGLLRSRREIERDAPQQCRKIRRDRLQTEIARGDARYVEQGRRAPHVMA